MAAIDNLEIQITASADEAVRGLQRLASASDRVRSSARGAAGATQDMAQSAEDMGTATHEAGEQAGRSASKIRSFWMSLRGVSTFAKGAIGAMSIIPKFFGKQLIRGIKDTVKGLGEFFASIKRIAMYRLIRTALKEITQGISEGTKNLYNWSQTADRSFVNAMDSIAASSQYMGNSIAAMASPLIESIAPAIDFIADKIVDLFNLINQVIARLSGSTSYTAAKRVAAQWGDASKKASGSAKKAADDIKRTILGFDEINKLNADNSRSGGGGGGSGSGLSGANMFETRPIDGGVMSFADQIKDAFTKGDWETLGKTIGDKINSIVDGIDFQTAGMKVGTAINGWFTTKYWTLNAINFTNIGASIADFLNNAIAKIDFEIIGRSMTQKLTVIGDAVIGFLRGFNWGQAASAISGFVTGLYNELTRWFSEVDWAGVGSSIANGLVNFIANIDYVGLATSLYDFLNGALEAGIGTITGFFDGLADKFKAVVKWDALSEDMQTGIAGIMTVLGLSTGVIGAILTFSGTNIPLGIGMMIAGGVATGTALSLQWDGLSDTLKDKIEVIKGIIYGASMVIGAIMTFSGANIPLGLGLLVAGSVGLANTISANWDILKEKLQGPIGAVTGLISGATLLLGILAIVGGMVPLGIGLILAGAAGLGTTIAANWDNMKKLGATAVKKVKEGWNSVKDKVVEFYAKVKNDAAKWWKNVKDWWGKKVGNVKEFVTNVLDDSAEWWKSVKGWWKEKVGSVKEFTTKVKNDAATWWSNVKSWWSAKVGVVKEFTTKVKNEAATWWANVKSWWNEKVSAVQSFKTNVKNEAATWWSNVKAWWKEKVSNVENFTTNLKNDAATWWDNAKSWWKEKVGAVEDFATNVKNDAATWWSNVKSWWSEKVGSVSSFTTSVANKASTWWSDVKGWWDTYTEGKSLVVTIAETASQWFETFFSWLNGNANKLASVTVKIFGEIPQWLANFLGINTGEEVNQIMAEDAGMMANAKEHAARMGIIIDAEPGTGIESFSDGSYNTLKPFNWISTRANLIAGTGIASFAENGGLNSLNGFSWITTRANLEAGTGINSLGASGGYNWLNSFHEAGAKISGKAGDGFKSLGSTNELNGIDSLSATINGKAGTGIDSLGSTNKLNGFGSQTVAVNTTNTGTNWAGGLLKWLTGNDKGETTVKVNLANGSGGTTWVAMTKALGGAFSGGVWSNIPQYAGGTLNAHGSLFLAGEAGPEIVGHVGGRTEVLNKSQLASAMFSAVRAALAPAAANFAYAAQAMGTTSSSEPNYAGLYEIIRDAMGNALANDNGNRERNQLLREINDKDMNVEVSTSSINKAQTRMNRRAGTTIVAVGT